jgi:hypothetical protein
MSELHVDLTRVFVAHDAAEDSVDSLLGLDFAHECMGTDYINTQEFARIVRESAEAMLVPSCTRLPEGSLVIFPDRSDRCSTIRLTASLYLALVK